MELSEDAQQEYSATELDNLTKVIDYSDRMLSEEEQYDVRGGMMADYGYASKSRAPIYRLLRKNGYAKTVVIETQLQGKVVIRLTPNEASITDASVGLCGPHAPLGQLATIAHAGFKGNSKVFGAYRVTEIRSFDRFDGPDFEPNVRNFLRMAVTGDAGNANVTDLQNFLKQVTKGNSSARATVEASSEATKRKVRSEPVKQKPSPPHPAKPSEKHPVFPPADQVPTLNVADEPDTEIAELDFDSEDESGMNRGQSAAEGYYGLNEAFFTHQTAEQNKIIARSPMGAMFVEGVAGSGKTSAALGRMKMLTSFSMTSVSNEELFHAVLGPDHDYWSAEYAGQFSQQSCIGFVRTGELTQYLSETCRRIDLPDLPVREFKELRKNLLTHRKLTTSFVPGRRWTGMAEQRQLPESTTMAWLRSTDQAIARYLADHFLQSIPTPLEVGAMFDEADRSKVARVAAPALTLLRTKLTEIADELRTPAWEGSFALDRLVAKLTALWEEVCKRVMGPTLIWTQVKGNSYFAADERALAQQLVWRKAELYRRSGHRLVFLDTSGPISGPIDKSLKFHRDPDGPPMPWSEEVFTLLKTGQVIVRGATGSPQRGVASSLNHLYLSLLPESNERIYELIGQELHRIPRDQGLGRMKLRLATTSVARLHADQMNQDGVDAADDARAAQVQRSTPDKVLTRLVTDRLLRPLTALPDLYLNALHANMERFSSVSTAQAVIGQLSQFKLDEEDIDLLMCVGHLLSRTVPKSTQAKFPSLTESSFYQAVFVDEVQDFTEQQVYLMVQQANPHYRAVTVVGDLAQKLHHGSSIDLRACFPGQTVSNIKLTENLRQTGAPGLALFSAMFRSRFHGSEPPSDRTVQGALAEGEQMTRPKIVTCARTADLDEVILNTLISVKDRHLTVAVLFPSASTAATTFKRLDHKLREQLIDAELSEKVNLSRRHVRHFSDVANAKGLEFDVVVLAHVEGFDLSRASDINRFYVGITRARQSLTLLSRKASLAPQLSSLLKDFTAIAGN